MMVSYIIHVCCIPAYNTRYSPIILMSHLYKTTHLKWNPLNWPPGNRVFDWVCGCRSSRSVRVAEGGLQGWGMRLVTSSVHSIGAGSNNTTYVYTVLYFGATLIRQCNTNDKLLGALFILILSSSYVYHVLRIIAPQRHHTLAVAVETLLPSLLYSVQFLHL